MCGIAGILSFAGNVPDPARARRMQTALAHRGPDGQGIAELGACTLLHTRLSIIDLLGGQQPMSVPACDTTAAGSPVAGHTCGSLTLTFNGEIYNHRALRRQLMALGHRFASDHCDTEVLLHGYREWGTELPKRLHGMFAFAIWDAGQRQLFLCRDRMGKKPLFLRRTQSPRNGELMFASLVSAIVGGLPAGESPRVNPRALLTFLRLGYTDETSLIEGITELPAASWLRVDSDGTATQQRYWQPPPISRSSTSMGALRATRELLEEAVAARLEADVPLGCFLSGGIDSSLIAALAHRQLLACGHGALKTFCVSMPDIDYDEAAYARRVAEHLGTQHTELTASPSESLFDDMRRLIAVAGEPTADSSILPTYWLCKAARREVTVALCGDGGDELFGGYDRYRAMRLLARHQWWLRLLPRMLLDSASPRSRRHRLARLVDAARQQGESLQYRSIIHLFSEAQIRELAEPFGPTPSQNPAAWSPAAGGVPIMLDDWPNEPDPAHAAMRWDLLHYLPFDLLRKMDRASMAVALEVRCPILDTQVLDLAGHLPTSVLMPGGRPKGLLRQVAAELLPAEIVERPKRGFAVPIGQWFRGPLKSQLMQHILEGELSSLGVNRYAAERMLEEHNRRAADHTHRLFALLMLSLWTAWIKNPTPAPIDDVAIGR